MKDSEVAVAPMDPLINPVEVLRLSPTGRFPEAIDHLYGGLPPVPANACA